VTEAMREALEVVAGPRAFARGEAYALDGRVRSLARRADVLTAVVEGTEAYSVRVRVSDDPNGLDGACTCPVGEGGGFCKHCVAAGLVWLERRDRRRGGAEAERLRRWLDALDAATLRGVLLEEAGRVPALAARLLLRAGHGDPGALREALDRAVDDRGAFVPYAEAGAYARGIDEAIDAIDGLLDADPATVVELAEHGLRRVEGVIERVDDSDGRVGDVLRKLEALHLASCQRARPDPAPLAERLFRWEQDSGWDVFHQAAERYAEVLGPAGLSRYRELASQAWERVPVRAPGDEDDLLSHVRITATMESIARAEGHIDELIAVMARDLSSPWRFQRIAEACRDAGRLGDAVEWARRGLDAFPETQDARLAGLLADLYSAMGQHDEAARAAFAAFASSPGLEAWRRLKGFARTAGSWSARRSDGLAHLERMASVRIEQAANARYRWERVATADELVRVLLEEEQPEEAWDAAVRYGASDRVWLDLARRRGEDHADDAAEVFRRLVGRAIDGKDRRSYREAAGLLAELRDILGAHGRLADFESTLDAVRQTHARKRALLDELGRAQAQWVGRAASRAKAAQ
jgi:uncharacterized Zn finger protein